MSSADWVTWAEAAELVGCTPRTLEYHVARGRIQRRPRDGTRPVLLRRSVLEFAAAHQARAAERANRPTGPTRAERSPQPPSEEGWLTVPEVAERLSVTPETVYRRIRAGHLDGVRPGRMWWVRTTSVEAELADRAVWVSRAAAAELVGCPLSVLARAVVAGAIERRPTGDGPSPTLRRTSVEAFAAAWSADPTQALVSDAATSVPGDRGEADWVSAEAAAAIIGCTPASIRQLVRSGLVTQRPARGRRPSIDRSSAEAYAPVWRRERAQRDAARRPRRLPSRLPCGHEWLPTLTAAIVLGVSPSRMRQAAAEGLLPFERDRGRLWFRRDVTEQVAARRALLRAHHVYDGLWWPSGKPLPS